MTVWTDGTRIDPPAADGFALPEGVAGWLTRDEGRALAELARGLRVLEIGSYCGLSTICLARTARQVVAMDYHDGRGTPRPIRTRATFDANLDRHGVYDRVVSMHPDEPLMGWFDLAFIDGAHDRASVAADIAKARRALRPGGLLAFHDYRRPIDPGVTLAVDALLAAGGELVSITDCLAVVRPPL